MSSITTSNWLKFFTNAGLPNPTAADYAHIFVKNRMQMNMLEEITKDYLREMNITAMGDIISILRYAKLVGEQLARDKILTQKSDEQFLIASVTAKPKLISTTSAIIRKDDSPKKRRVLPEREDKYKMGHSISSTSRSKEISARSNVNNDIEMADNTSKTADQIIKIVGIRGSESSMKQQASIFNRLGSKKTDSEIEEESKAPAGILKNSAMKKIPSVIVKANVENLPPPRKVLNSRLGLNSSSETLSANSKKNMVKLKPSKLRAQSSSESFIHSTKKVIKLKPSVHQRLSIQNKTSRNKRFSLDSVSTSSADTKKIFSRLGSKN